MMAPRPLVLLLRNMPHADDLQLNLYDNDKKKPGLRFSLGLYRFISSCPTLVQVQLSGPIYVDESLFWSPKSDSDDDQWLSLKYFHVGMSLFRPDGGWYPEEHTDFLREEPCRPNIRETDSDSEHDSIHSDAISNDDADDDYNAPADSYCRRRRHWEAVRAGDAYILYFRAEPTKALERVWTAAARAAAAMPKLCLMSVTVTANQCPRTDVKLREFGFAHGAVCHNDEGRPDDVPQVDWTALRGCKMGEELQTLWEQVLGPEGEVKYGYW